MVAERLARAGVCVRVFEERLGWEKPCGGGLTPKAMRRYPFLLEAAIGARRIDEAEFIAPRGETVRLRLRRPLAVCSRSVLNRKLLERAQQSGAKVVADRIVRFERSNQGWALTGRERDYTADYLVLAAGARSRMRAALGPDFAPKDFMLTFGYLVPGAEEVLRLKFFEGFEGYAWAFPRADHLSVGICAKVGEERMAELQTRLHEFMERLGYPQRGAEVFAHLLPAPSASAWSSQRIAGKGWALVGDAAGFVDPLTGEGIYYAMRSGELLGECLLEGAPASYPERAWQEFGSELAHGARLANLYYHSDMLGKTLSTRMIQICRRSERFRDLLQDLVDGTQPYSRLVGRLYRELGGALVEVGARSLTRLLSGHGPDQRHRGMGPDAGHRGRGSLGTLAPQ